MATTKKGTIAIFLKQVMMIARESSLATPCERKRGKREAVAFNSSFSFRGCLGERKSAMAVLVSIAKEAIRDAICTLEGCLSARVKIMKSVRIV